MVNYHLDSAKNEMLNGDRSDQEIDTSTVVEFSKQVNIRMSGKASDDLEDAIKSFFGGSIVGGFESVVSVAVDAVLENTSMGEHEVITCSSCGQIMHYSALMHITILLLEFLI